MPNLNRIFLIIIAVGCTLFATKTFASDSSAKNSVFRTLKISGTDQSQTETIQLKQGEIAKTHKVYNFSFDSLSYMVSYEKSDIIRPQGETVYGPCMLTITGNKSFGSGFAYIIIEIVDTKH